MIIGITGYIGVGKTTAAQYFGEYGLKIIDVDRTAHGLLMDEAIKQKIMAKFGAAVIDRTLQIDRKKLGDVVFNHPGHLDELNKIVHINLKKEVIKEIMSHKKAVVDVALLKDLGLEKYCDKIILIKADLEKIYRRMAGKYTKRQIINIMNKQNMPLHPHFEIDNNGTLGALKVKVKEIMDAIKTV